MPLEMRLLPALSASLLLVVLPSCVVHEARPLPPPMSEAEAVQRGERWCGEHGYACRVRQVVQRGDLVEVLLDADGHGTRGPLRLEYGLYDHRLLRVEVPTLAPSGPRPADQREVVQAGDRWCQSRGYRCVLESAHVEGQARWVLQYRVDGPARGRVALTYDAFNRSLLGVREDVHG
jgi:hypothetical protein